MNKKKIILSITAKPGTFFSFYATYVDCLSREVHYYDSLTLISRAYIVVTLSRYWVVQSDNL